MTQGAPGYDPAMDAMMLSLLSKVLRLADRPEEMGAVLTEEIRELTGARCILFVRCPELAGETAHRVVSVNPARRRDWAESPSVRCLYDAVHRLERTQLWQAQDSLEATECLRGEGFALSLIVPLHEGAIRQGEMLLLGLPDQEHLAAVSALLECLAPAIALVLRNAFLYEKQDRLIQERTAELSRVNQQLQVELGERSRAQESLRESEQQVRSLLERSEASGRALLGILEDQKHAEEAIRQQASELAALNVLARDVGRSLSLDEVVTAAVGGLVEAVKADAAFLFVREGEHLWLKGAAPESGRRFLSNAPVHHVGECLCGMAAQGGKPVYSPDIHVDARCTWQECREQGIRSFAALPLHGGEDVIGVVGLASFARRDFASQADFLETLASAIASGIHNARLFAAARQAEEDLRQSQERLARIVETTPSGIMIVDGGGHIAFANPAAETILGVTREVITARTYNDPAWKITTVDGRPLTDERLGFARVMRSQQTVHNLEEAIEHADGRRVILSVNAAPLRDGAGNLTGTVVSLTDITERRRLLEQLRQINAELEQRVQERTAVAEERAAQLRTLARRLTMAEHLERRRVAYILHEHFQQLLVSAKFNMGAVRRQLDDARLHEPLRHVEETIDEAIRVSRSLAVELCPPILYDMGLAVAMEWLGRWMEDKYHLKVDVQADPRANPRAEDINVLLFHSTRELLFNVVKHAHVQEAGVRMSLKDGQRVEILVVDEGEGFESSRRAGGFGLSSIRERLELVGGQLDVRSQPGSGTQVRMMAPIQHREASAGQGPGVESG